MRIYYGLTADGKHVTANASAGPRPSLTPMQQRLLCEVFASICQQKEEKCPTPIPPQRIGCYVRIRVGVEDGRAFVEYSPCETH